MEICGEYDVSALESDIGGIKWLLRESRDDCGCHAVMKPGMSQISVSLFRVRSAPVVQLCMIVRAYTWCIRTDKRNNFSTCLVEFP